MSTTNGHPARDARWPRLAPEALYGLPGRLVAAIDQHEIDAARVLPRFLEVACG